MVVVQFCIRCNKDLLRWISSAERLRKTTLTQILRTQRKLVEKYKGGNIDSFWLALLSWWRNEQLWHGFTTTLEVLHVKYCNLCPAMTRCLILCCGYSKYRLICFRSPFPVIPSSSPQVRSMRPSSYGIQAAENASGPSRPIAACLARSLSPVIPGSLASASVNSISENSQLVCRQCYSTRWKVH
jgi:hypothetical protein